jgi:hypothetical protein
MQQVLATPSLRFPLQAGGTDPLRFPSRSGGNLTEGGKLLWNKREAQEQHPDFGSPCEVGGTLRTGAERTQHASVG